MTTYAPSRTTSTGLAAIGTASALLAAVCTALGAHDWREIGIITPVIVVTAALVFGVVVPRALRKESAGGTALALGIPAALLLVPAFWAGVPLVLGAAAMVVGNAGRRARTGSGTCIAGFVLGALAVVGYVAIYVSDLSSGGTGFLLG